MDDNKLQVIGDLVSETQERIRKNEKYIKEKMTELDELYLRMDLCKKETEVLKEQINFYRGLIDKKANQYCEDCGGLIDGYGCITCD